VRRPGLRAGLLGRGLQAPGQARPGDEAPDPAVWRRLLQSRGDAFTTLARSIVGQQISVKAAQSVWDRFEALPRKP
jgi:3-methyladenine DNA glycosylase/8-oxoguanine DNA glycosylase